MHSRNSFFVGLIGFVWLALGSTVPNCLAGLNTWTSNGPDGARVDALATDPANPSFALLGTPGGIYRTANSGLSWTRVHPESNITALAVCAANPSLALAGRAGKILRSSNGGNNWTVVPGVPSANDLAFDPSSNCQVAYLASYSGVYRSDDGGSTWTPRSNGLTNTLVQAFAIAPSNPQILYAGSHPGGSSTGSRFKSIDGGANWTEISGAHSWPWTVALVVDPANPQVVYAAEAGLKKSTDGGATWSTLIDDSVLYPSTVVLDPINPLRVITAGDRGIWRSENAGTTFTRVGTGLLATQSPGVKKLAYAAGQLFAGTWGLVFRSANHGTSWMLASAGLRPANTRSMAVSPGSDLTLFAEVYGAGLAKSTDAGATWRYLENGAPSGIGGIDSHLAISPADPNRLYICDYSSGVWVSTDGGESFFPSLVTGSSTYGNAVAAHPAVAAVAYAATGTWGGSNWGSEIWKTTNGGESWTSISEGLSHVEVLAVDPRNPARIWAAGCGLYVSTDAGASWVSIWDGGGGCYVQNRVLVEPVSSPSVVYVTYFLFMFGAATKSYDNGETWYDAGGGMEFPISAYDPANPSALFAGNLETSNQGESWVPLDPPLPAGVIPYFHALDSTGAIHHVATDQGVWSYEDGCHTPPAAVVSGTATICLGASAVLQVALTGPPPWNLVWTDGFIQSAVTTSPSTRVVSPTATTAYRITSVSNNRCPSGRSFGSAVITVNPTPAPSATITAPASTCGGAAGLTASVPDAGAGATYAWIVGNGTLTAGSGTAVITFTAGASGQTILDVTVLARNGCANASSHTVALASIALAPASLVSGVLGIGYSQTVSASGGTPPHLFTVTSGVLPSGLSLDAASGVISGTPGAIETASFTVTATDSVGCTGQNSYVIEIECVALSPLALPDATLGASYNQTLVASGGTPPYNFTLAGALPAGLVLDAASGQISGTPTEPGRFILTATVADSGACTASRLYTLAVCDPAMADLNLTTTVNASDAVILANYLVGNLTQGAPPFTAPLAQADLDRSTSVISVDAVILANFLVGNILCLPTM